MIVAPGGDGEPDVADDAGALGEKDLFRTSGWNVPEIVVAAGAVVARLLQRSVVLRSRIGGQQGHAAAPGLRLRRRRCHGADAGRRQRATHEIASWIVAHSLLPFRSIWPAPARWPSPPGVSSPRNPPHWGEDHRTSAPCGTCLCHPTWR